MISARPRARASMHISGRYSNA